MSSNGKALLMAVKLLVFGLPGSGKSTIARHITIYLKDRNWESIHFSDHVILNEMFHADSEGKLFRPTDHGGFDVLDFIVFDIALRMLEQEVNQHLLSAKQEEIVLIEFARNDYLRAFQQISDTFLQDAHFLHLDVETETCKSRIRERTANPNTKDDFFVSEYIFNTYYNKDDGQEIPQILERNYRIDKQRIKVIKNNGSFDDIVEEINEFVDRIGEFENLRGS
jgi:adenylate kinase family enzyme